MGSCCFTPKKTQLLWWYWLLLLSIVGIPIFFAALYISRRSQKGEPKREDIRNASRIFWITSVISCISFFVLAIIIWNHAGFIFLLNRSTATEFIFAFFFWLAVATSIAGAVEKRKRAVHRLVILLGCLFGCLFLILAAKSVLPWGTAWASHSILMLPVSLMRFAVCMLPAHYWNRFSVSPNRRTAWNWLFALVGGTFLFWLVTQCGDIVHLHFYDLVRPGHLAKVGFFQDLFNALF